MNILIIGSGGREHALAWKLKQSLGVKNIFVAPGNAGTSAIAKNVPLSKTNEIIDWIKGNPVDLVVVGPDNYLADGIADKLQKMKIEVFGPTKLASEIEWSKSFAKQFMKEESIPTADFEIFSDIKKAKKYVSNHSFPLVIKANGLALGKGAIIVNNIAEAGLTLKEIMQDKVFGEAGNQVVIEEYLNGDEISIHAFCDGEYTILFPPSQDHKRILDGDKGKNTGGMGTITPVPWISDRQMSEIEEKIVKPTLHALKNRGRTFKGILFPGIMITKDGPKVIEFNARFGDPETQSYMRLLESDLLPILLACIDGNLKDQDIIWSKKSACCIVCASSGYPGKYEKGKIINGLDKIRGKGVEVFHAGTKLDKKQIVSNGGRVLGVTSTGNNLKEALNKAYKNIESISFEGMQYRKDIGVKSLHLKR
jgi:phosphoribosylamine--glycine ligase